MIPRQSFVLPRRGVTLLELLVVVTLLGIFAATAGMRFGRSLFSEVGAQTVSRELSLAMLRCQRAAIATGDDHYLEFFSSGGQIVEYRVMRDQGGSAVLVDGPRTISQDVTVTVSHGTMRFQFEGSAQAAYSVIVTGQSRVWRIDVVPVTGTAMISQVS